MSNEGLEHLPLEAQDRIIALRAEVSAASLYVQESLRREKALRASVLELKAALEQFQFAYPYDPPCHNWASKAIAHKMAKKALRGEVGG